MTGRSLGRGSKFYLDTGTYGSPSFNEVANISDLKITREWETADASTRESSMKMAVKTLVDMSVEGKIKFVAGDSLSGAILDAADSPDAVIDIMVLNGPMTTPGVRGVRFECQVTSCGEDQGLSAVLFEEVKFTPTPNGNPPCTVKVIGSAPVFTSI